MIPHVTLRFSVWIAAVLLAGLTRFPATHFVLMLMVGFAALASIGLGGMSLWSKAPRKPRVLLFPVAMGLLLLSPSPQAVLSGIPEWAVALLFVLGLHMLYQDPGTIAPRLDPSHVARSVWKRLLLRYLPAALFALALIVMPLVFLVMLPERIHATWELHSAYQPLFVFLVLGLIVVALGVLRVHLFPRFSSRLNRVDLPGSAQSALSEGEVESS